MPKHPYPKHPNKSERGVKTMEINKNKEIYRSDQRNEIDNLYFHPHGGSHDNRWPNLLSHVIIVLNLSNKNSDRESENKTTPGIGVEIWEEGRGEKYRNYFVQFLHPRLLLPFNPTCGNLIENHGRRPFVNRKSLWTQKRHVSWKER